MGTDFSQAQIPGPWRDRFIAAGGSRFHLAVAGPDDGEAGLVVFLHGFPQFWWAWRHQLTAVAEAGYRAVAMDLRGFAASDKPPSGYTLPSMARDVAAVIASLGAERAVVVGQGLGGLVTWTMTSYTPSALRAVAVFDAPHPVDLVQRRRAVLQTHARRLLLPLASPLRPENALVKRDLTGQILRSWGATASWIEAGDAARYRDIMRVSSAANRAIGQLRWLKRSAAHQDRRRYLTLMHRPAPVPVLHVQGAADPLLRASAVRSPDFGGPDYRFTLIAAGHFVPEEAPTRTNELLLSWLAEVAG